MKRHLFSALAMLLLVTVWGTGCGGRPTPAAPIGERSVAQAEPEKSYEARETMGAGTDIPTPRSQRDEPMPAQAQSTVTSEMPETLDAGPGVPTPSAESQIEEAAMTPELTPEAGDLEMLPEAEEVVRLAREDLAGRLGLAPEAIELVSIETVEWSDASLGCPQPGMMYAQVITPGFRVVLEAGGERYAYHTDEGRFVVLCEEERTSDMDPSKGPDTTVKDGGPNQTRDDDVIIAPQKKRQ